MLRPSKMFLRTYTLHTAPITFTILRVVDALGSEDEDSILTPNERASHITETPLGAPMTGGRTHTEWALEASGQDGFLVQNDALK